MNSEFLLCGQCYACVENTKILETQIKALWHMPLIPSTRGRGGQISAFEARLVYTERPSSADAEGGNDDD